jgi:hypothetical protein
LITGSPALPNVSHQPSSRTLLARRRVRFVGGERCPCRWSSFRGGADGGCACDRGAGG